MALTIYEELGGAPAVEAVVDELYRRLLADSTLGPYFEGKDLARIKAHQRALVTVAMGGVSETHSGQMLHPAHKRLGVTDPAFDAVLGHLADVLLDAGAEPWTVAKVMAILQPLRADIVQAHTANATGRRRRASRLSC